MVGLHAHVWIIAWHRHTALKTQKRRPTNWPFYLPRSSFSSDRSAGRKLGLTLDLYAPAFAQLL